MRKLLPLLILLTETRKLRMYLYAFLAIGLLSSISEILIFLTLQSYQTPSQHLESSRYLSILTLALLFAITKPIILLIGAKYSGVLEEGLYLDACYSSLSFDTPTDSGDESQIVANSLINPLRISNTVIVPFIFAVPAAISGVILVGFLATMFPGQLSVLCALGLLYFAVLSKYINKQLRSFSNATQTSTIKAKALLTFFNKDKANLNFHGLLNNYMAVYAKIINIISNATTWQIYYNNISKIIFEILAIFLIVYSGISNEALSQGGLQNGIRLGILLFVLSRLFSICNQIYGVVLSINTNFSQLASYLRIRSLSNSRQIGNTAFVDANIIPESRKLDEMGSRISVVAEKKDIQADAMSTQAAVRYKYFDDLILDRGKLTVLMGDSGAGKSTLIRQILYSRCEFNKYGSHLFKLGDHNIIDNNKYFCLGSIAYYLSQSFRITGIKMAELLDLKAPDFDFFCQDLACLLGDSRTKELLEARDNFYLDGLSGGFQQRLFLAFASGSPQPVVIVDEALDGLDNPAKRRTIQLLLARGKSILMVTHNPSIPFPVEHRYLLEKAEDNSRLLKRI